MSPSLFLLVCLAIRVAQREDAREQFLGIELADEILTDLLADLLQTSHFLLRDRNRLDTGGGLQESECLALVLPHVGDRLGIELAHGLTHERLLLRRELVPEGLRQYQ